MMSPCLFPSRTKARHLLIAPEGENVLVQVWISSIRVLQYWRLAQVRYEESLDRLFLCNQVDCAVGVAGNIEISVFIFSDAANR